MHEVGGLGTAGASSLCLDQGLGLRVEKLNSFSGLINIKMQFLIELEIFIFRALQLVCIFLHHVSSLVPSLKPREAVPKAAHKFTQNKCFQEKRGLQLEHLRKAGQRPKHVALRHLGRTWGQKKWKARPRTPEHDRHEGGMHPSPAVLVSVCFIRTLK